MTLAYALPVLAQTVRLQDNVPPNATRLRPSAPAEPSTILSLSIAFLPRDQAGMDVLLAAQQDPGSALYHKWLTPEEFSARFGPAEKDFTSVSKWLNTSGFQISGGSPQEGLIRFTGYVATRRNEHST